MLKRHDPGDGKCVWCGMNEDCDHIIFRCIVARFSCSIIRAATGCSWNPVGFADFYHLPLGASGADRRMAWMGFPALALIMWNTRNKALIEGKLFQHSADLIYKMVIILQLCKLLAKQKDRPRVEKLIVWLQGQCTELRRQERTNTLG